VGASFTLVPEGPFDLRQSVRFASGFAPIPIAGDDSRLAMAFADEGGEPVAFAAGA
jgi:hypothetical protein